MRPCNALPSYRRSVNEMDGQTKFHRNGKRKCLGAGGEILEKGARRQEMEQGGRRQEEEQGAEQGVRSQEVEQGSRRQQQEVASAP